MNLIVLPHSQSGNIFKRTAKIFSLSAHVVKAVLKTLCCLFLLPLPKNKYRLIPISNRKLENTCGKQHENVKISTKPRIYRREHGT